MRIVTTMPLFAWEALDDSPDLQTIRRFLAAIPDGKLLASLRSARGRGRNEAPVHVAWGVVLLTAALRHSAIEATLAELRRNRPLGRLIGIEGKVQVPKKWNMSRFLAVLGRQPHLTLLREIFDQIVRALGQAVPDLGRDVAGDSAALSARRTQSKGIQKMEAHEGLPQADGGRKEYTDEAGNVVKSYQWFGFKLHGLVDVKHEVFLAYHVSSPKLGDNEGLAALVEQAQANLPADRIKTLAYDKAADDQKVHEYLDDRKIAPVIHNRRLWKQETERMLPGHDGRSNVVYDEAGTVYCYNQVSHPPVKQKMAYIGHEDRRGTLKYRCPARHEGWRCPSHERCNAGRKYGKTVRIKRDQDLRRFPPIPRATKKFEQRYKGRTSVERAFGRTKMFWGADDGNVAGSTRFHAWLGTVMVVHAAFALLLASLPRRDGTLGRMRIGPIAEALQARTQRW